MAKNNLNQYLEKKYGERGVKEIIQKFSNQKQRYIEQGKK